MLYKKWNIIFKIVLTILIGVTSFLGDICLKYVQSPVTRAISDNLTHALVGGLTWMLILILSKKNLVQNLYGLFLSFALSSFIDVDHFLSARSWRLSDVTNLSKRPFLHCTTVPILLWIILILISTTFNNQSLNDFSWIIFASFLSHHIRDATRRGLWFCPLGTTQPIPYYMYIAMSMMLPYILHWFMQFRVLSTKANEKSMTVSSVSIV